MSGGIIIQRFSVLKPAATAPSIYGTLPTDSQLIIDGICSKAPGHVTVDDIQKLGVLIMLATHCF